LLIYFNRQSKSQPTKSECNSPVDNELVGDALAFRNAELVDEVEPYSLKPSA